MPETEPGFPFFLSDNPNQCNTLAPTWKFERVIRQATKNIVDDPYFYYRR